MVIPQSAGDEGFPKKNYQSKLTNKMEVLDYVPYTNTYSNNTKLLLTTTLFLLVFLTSSATCKLSSTLSPSFLRHFPATSTQVKLGLASVGGFFGRPKLMRRSSIGFVPFSSSFSIKKNIIYNSIINVNYYYLQKLHAVKKLLTVNV